LPGKKKTSPRRVLHAHPLLCFIFAFTLFLLASFYQKHKKIVTTQDFIKFWGKFFAFVLLEMIGISQGFKTF
jgi:hypothetical protein